MTIQLDGPGVTIADVVAVARQGERVELTPAALVAMETARATVERLAEGAPNYGISTGFGVGHGVDPAGATARTSRPPWSAPTPPAWATRSRTRWCGR